MWVAAILMCTINQWDKAFEAVIAFPGHLLISIGYYAAVNAAVPAYNGVTADDAFPFNDGTFSYIDGRQDFYPFPYNGICAYSAAKQAALSLKAVKVCRPVLLLVSNIAPVALYREAEERPFFPEHKRKDIFREIHVFPLRNKL